jgi:hypothetical protein
MCKPGRLDDPHGCHQKNGRFASLVGLHVTFEDALIAVILRSRMSLWRLSQLDAGALVIAARRTSGRLHSFKPSF